MEDCIPLKMQVRTYTGLRLLTGFMGLTMTIHDLRNGIAGTVYTMTSWVSHSQSISIEAKSASLPYSPSASSTPIVDFGSDLPPVTSPSLSLSPPDIPNSSLMPA